MDELTARRLELERMTDIPDMQEYAGKWRKLAADFRFTGRPATAAMCDSKAAHYEQLVPARYVRKFEAINLVTLKPVL